MTERPTLIKLVELHELVHDHDEDQIAAGGSDLNSS